MQKQKPRCGTFALIAWMLLTCGPAAAQSKATIAVLPFELGAGIAGDQLDTAVLVDTFNRVLVSSRKFSVVDRARMSRVARERRFQRQTRAGRVNLGNYLGAQYLVMGTVQDYSLGAAKELPYASGWTRAVRISVEVQVVDTGSGEIVAAKKAEGSAQSRFSSAADADSDPQAAIERATEELAQAALIEILAGVFPIKVVEVSGGEAMLNRGNDSGLAAGERLRCFSPGKTMRDPDTGEVLGAAEIPSGTVQVSEILPKFTKAEIIGGQVAPRDTCRSDGTVHSGSLPTPGPIHSF
ncbi:MAG TPA: LPS assembly lipoprotein LptE [Terriglobales bacterium]|nr:LPS assembly lipoprotein LptE [Terriglobales bacterium]